MRVLYVSGATGADYQCDVVMHGLRSLLGPDLVDVNKMWFMYDTSEPCMFHSLYKLLPDIEVDRNDIESKIQSKYFDAIIYGSVHRCRDYIQLVLDSYPRNRIAFIDGEDGPELAPAVGHGWYFKREIYEPHPNLLPIQFGIPKDKIRPIDLSRKTRLMAHCDPRDRSTYVYYDSEQRYYDQYSDAYFGYTMKKGGWDCMRHHEILASGTLPYFQDFDNCPSSTLFNFNRDLMRMSKEMYDSWSSDYWQVEPYETLLSQLQEFGLMSTEAIATRILERLQ